MAKTVEVYFGINLASLVCDLYNAGTTTVAANDVTFNQSAKPGYFIGNIGTLAAGLYDLVETTGLGADQVKVGEADNTLYKCYGHSYEWTDNIGTPTIGSGQYTITLKAQSSPTAPIPGAMFTITQGSAIIAWGNTLANGTLPVQLNAGTYTVGISAHGFVAIANQSLVVTAPANATYTMTQVAITPPPIGGMCRVLVTVVKADQVQSGVDVTADLTDKASTITSGIEVLIVAKGVTNNAGQVELLLPWTSTFVAGTGIYRIRAKESGSTSLIHDRNVTIPDMATATYNQLPTANVAD